MTGGQILTDEQKRKAHDMLLKREQAKNPGAIVRVVVKDALNADGSLDYTSVVTTETIVNFIDPKL